MGWWTKSLYRKWLFHQTSIYKWLALGFQAVIYGGDVTDSYWKKRNQKPKDWNSKIKNQVISKWFPKKKQKMEKAPKSMVSRWCFSIFSFLGRRIQYTMTSQPTNQPTNPPNILVAKTTGLLIRFFLERKLTWSQQNYIICC